MHCRLSARLRGSRRCSVDERFRDVGSSCGRSNPPCRPPESVDRAKIESKSVPGGSPGHPKSIQNRSGDLPELPGAPGRHPRASWSIPGAPREGPKGGPGAPEGSPRPPRGAEKGTRERPETPRDDRNRRRVASGSEKVNYSSHGSLGKASRSDFRLIFESCAQRAHLNPCAQGGVY